MGVRSITQVDDHRGGVVNVADAVVARLTIENTGQGCAILEGEGIIARPTQQIVEGGTANDKGIVGAAAGNGLEAVELDRVARVTVLVGGRSNVPGVSHVHTG